MVPIPRRLLVFTTLLMLIKVISCSAHCRYNISPSCPNQTYSNHVRCTNGTAQCVTMSNIVSNVDIFLSDNTTLVFLPGDHYLQEEVVHVANTSSITLSGYSNQSAKIICTNTSLAFSDVSDLLVTSLEFVSCKMSLSSTAAIFKDTNFVDSCTSHGGAIFACNGSTADFIGRTTFTGNTATMAGGAIFSDSSNLSFSGNTIFEDNQAGGVGGGGLFLIHSFANFTGITTFSTNSVTDVARCNQTSSDDLGPSYWDTATKYGGGGILALDSTILAKGETVFVQNTMISENLDDTGGGGMYLNGSNASITGFTQMSTNNVTNYGGGALVFNSTLSLEGTNELCNNQAGDRGGAMYAIRHGVLNLNGTNTFVNNTAGNRGNGIYAYVNNNVSIAGNSYFTSTHYALRGGGIYVLVRNSLKIYGNCTFEGNSATHAGAVYVYRNNSLDFEGHMWFLNNSAVRGGVMRVSQSNNFTFIGVSVFENNNATDMGGALDLDHYNNVYFKGKNTFKHNTGRRGGALFIQRDTHLNLWGENTFSHNYGEWGGAITAWIDSTVTIAGSTLLEYNSATIGGGMYVLQESTATITGNVTFYQNSAIYLGGGMAVRDSTASFDGYTEFTGNAAKHGGAVYIEHGVVALKGAGSLSNNAAWTITHSGFGGAVVASSSTVEFSGTDWEIVNNTADFGGGIALTGIEDRTLFLETNTTVLFEANVAHFRGGALFVENNPYIYCEFPNNMEVCFLQHDTRSCYAVFFRAEHDTTEDNLHLVFANNTAGEVGNVIHGGSLESCGYCTGNSGTHYITGWEIFDIVVNISSSVDSSRDISTEPFKVCACSANTSQPDCDQEPIVWRVFPEQTMSISVVALGQRNTSVPSVVRVVPSEGIQVNESQIVQAVGAECTEVQYTLTNVNATTEGTIMIYADEPCSVSGIPLIVTVEFLPCPTGFTTNSDGQCDCEERLADYDIECNVFDNSFLRSSGDTYWVGLSSSSSTPGLILHPHCPFDYCREEQASFTLNNTNLQCAHSRAGLACGGCQPGLSLALGSSRCLSCSNAFITLLIPFALAGVVLVVLLFTLQLTVSTGLISGLVFYANILAVNRRIFFPPGDTNVLTVFVAWLNLDLGIETCFIDGLDAYYRTWLQFVFPVYIWVLVGLIWVLANCSNAIARAISDANPVSVLATLFLLSYTKLIRTTCSAAFSFTSLEYPGDETRTVWLYDGNIGYLDGDDGRHIILFVFSALVFVVFLLPYSTVLCLGQWIQKKLPLKCISKRSSLRLKAFIDAYEAPYKDKHCYWVGLLLFVRLVILLVAAVIDVNNPQDPRTILMVMLVILLCLHMWAWPVVGGIYEVWYLDVLEASFIVNLLILIGGTYQVTLSGGSQSALVYISVGVALLTFTGIVIFSISKKQLIQKYLKRTARRFSVRSEPDSPGDVFSDTVSQVSQESVHRNSTSTTIDLVEYHTPFHRYDHRDSAISLRESVLEIVAV